MDFLYRSKLPDYKGKAAQPTQAGAGFLAGLWCYLFGGGAAPAYRGNDDANGATVPAASPCWGGLTGTPSYKQPPDPASALEPEVSPYGEEPPDEECPCEPGVEPEPREIHIYPGV